MLRADDDSPKKEDRNIIPHVIIIGAGSTGSATAHDLALRGLCVTVLERGEVAFGTTGRNHCLLHSGGRYCVTDQESAIECIEENMIADSTTWCSIASINPQTAILLYRNAQLPLSAPHPG